MSRPMSRPFLLRVGIAVGLLVLFLAARRLADLWVDFLWWSEELGQKDTFVRILEAEWGWGLLFGALSLVVTGTNLWLARRVTTSGVEQHGRLVARVIGGVVLLMALQSGFSFGARHWPDILLWQHRQSFDLVEPIFRKDAGFYVFVLPFLQRVAGWFFGLIVLNMAGVAAVYAFRAAGRLGLKPVAPGRYVIESSGRGDPDTWNRLLTHLSVLGALLFVGFAARTMLSQWELLYGHRSVVYGPGYTDVHVLIPALRVMGIVLLGGAGLFLAAAFARGLKATLKAIQWALVPVVLVWLLGLNVIPGLVQRYKVSPNETALELPYVKHNMAFTRQAFGLTDDHVEVRDFPPLQAVDAQALAADSVTLANIRLWDWRALESTYDQNQSFRQYYDFHDVDIDRYRVGGDLRQVMLSLRELNQRSFSENAVTWVNLRQIYTHGYGLCMSPTNEFTPEGLPNYWVRDIPPVVIDSALAVTRPEIYFGELTTGHVYVNTAQREFDYPKGDENVYARYEGTGGIRLGAGLRRLALALRYDGLRQLTSGDLSAESRILFRREVRNRAATVAPFLSWDDDPYAVLADGQPYILLDGYTTSDHFPYSEGLRNGLNYIRNSVKAVVDCYDGTVDFYVADGADPIIRAWQAAFPSLLKPIDAMPAALRDHLRYPEDLINIQAHVYATYHMADPLVFYNKEDRWAIARESLGQGRAEEMIPYYAVMKLPGEAVEEYVQLIPFTPFTATGPTRNNMVGWMAGRCDGEHYGKLLVYRFPKQSLVYGPMQIEARIDQDADIAKDLSLWNQQGSNVIRGNMIVLPLQNAIVYTKPIFLQATHSRMPELKRVVVAGQERLGYGETYPEALADLVERPLPAGLYRAITGRWPEGQAPMSAADSLVARATGVGWPDGRPEAGSLEAGTVSEADLRRARDHYQRYLELMGSGRPREAGEELERLGRALGVSSRN
jgi:uncharacterized membrane protein (UPF0182 family)